MNHQTRLLDEHQRARLNSAKLPDWLRSMIQNALHDLDIADARIEELEAAAICESGRRDGEFAEARATIAQQVTLISEMSVAIQNGKVQHDEQGYKCAFCLVCWDFDDGIDADVRHNADCITNKIQAHEGKC